MNRICLELLILAAASLLFSLFLLQVDISLGEHELVVKKSNKGNALHKLSILKISKVLDLVSDSNADTVQLQCNGSFLLRGEAEDRKVKHAIVSLKLIKSNRVVGVHAKLLRSTPVGNSCDDIPCLRPSMEYGDCSTGESQGKKQFKLPVSESFDIAIQSVTEDGVEFVPSVDSFEVTAKFCKYETPLGDSDSDDPYLPSDYVMRGKNVNTAALFSRLDGSEDPLTSGRSFRYSGVLSKEHSADGVLQVGLYEITIAYSEMREGPQYQTKGKKKVR